ncbi:MULTISPECIES: dynamin family protein [Rhodomicrobium]|uniref:dynamin family protein n=1 Tax=Rhodomicrobium TaxID=1068 RepID=UPI00148260E5|nr:MULTISPECIES: dynamin family protein [Rhodomicrobium]
MASPIEIDISNAGGATSIYASRGRAVILGSVLAAPDPSANDNTLILAKRADAGPAPQSAASRIRVGEELKSARDEITALGAELAALGDATIAAYVSGILGLVDGQICNIAVLGQMNSGKSTLVNAFIQQPDFLPAEITPWTTVVTNLHFAVPNMPRSGVEFEFFDADEWQRLAEGSARMRELTERLIPNFDWPTFYRQVGDMREKAKQKMGPKFEELLGGQHSFPEVTPGLLQKYVCAEPAFEEPEEAGTGEFSLITKAANLYFDLGGFYYPTLLIDTPGINDPFLVRDEITRQNLERANIFIIVVTARQPLSNADVDLLRILRGLDKHRIIVFVNKIDEVEAFSEVESAVVGRVRGVLDKEFPGARIPVITGSARWAGSGLSAAAEAELDVIPSGAPLSASEIAALGEDGRSFWMPDSSLQELIAAEDVLIRSGVPALAVAVSEMMRSGPIADCLAFAAAALGAIAANCAAVAQAQADLAKRLLAGATDEAALGALRQEQAAAASVAQEIVEIIAGCRSRFGEQVKAGLAALRQQLTATLDAHATAIAAPGTRAEAAAEPSVNVTPLRAALEHEFSQGFAAIHAGIGEAAAQAEARIQALVGRANDTAGMAVLCLPLPALKLTPPLAALADPIALAAGGTIQAQWHRQQISAEERGARFRELVRTQFAAIIDKLCDAAAAETGRATAFILDHFRVSVLHCIETAKRSAQATLDAVQPGAAAGDAEALEAQAQTLRARAEACRRLAENLTALRS